MPIAQRMNAGRLALHLPIGPSRVKNSLDDLLSSRADQCQPGWGGEILIGSPILGQKHWLTKGDSLIVVIKPIGKHYILLLH